MAAVLDYHLHVWPHGQAATPLTVARIAAYCERAAVNGAVEIALTEHLFRFARAGAVLGGFWDRDPDPALRSSMAAYWAAHATADLDAYVDTVLAAKADGLPVVLGLEVDHVDQRMDKVAALLEGYPFDVLLGSVHWLGAWGFDNWEDTAFAAEWDARRVDAVWDAYAEAVADLAGSGVCDVLAHPDLCKVTGRRPDLVDGFHDRLADAVAGAGMVAEVSSAGWRKPVGEAYPAAGLLRRLADRGVPVTTASDAHTLAEVGAGLDGLRPLLADAGYRSVTAFAGRARRSVVLR